MHAKFPMSTGEEHKHWALTRGDSTKTTHSTEYLFFYLSIMLETFYLMFYLRNKLDLVWAIQ